MLKHFLNTEHTRRSDVLTLLLAEGVCWAVTVYLAILNTCNGRSDDDYRAEEDCPGLLLLFIYLFI